MSDEIAELLETLARIRCQFEDLAVGGLRALGPERVAPLRSMAAEFTRVGATHIADRLQQLADAIEQGDRSAGRRLMRAQSSVRVFERALTLESVQATLGAMAQQSQAEDG